MATDRESRKPYLVRGKRTGITEVTSTMTGKTRYEARVSWSDGGGMRVQERERFDDVESALTWREDKMRDIRRGTVQRETTITIGEYFELWYTRKARVWRSSTAYTNRGIWDRTWKPRLASIRLDRLTRAMYQAHIDELAATETRPGTTVTPATILLSHQLMSSLMNAAVDDELIARNPIRRVILPTAGDKEYRLWNDHELARFLADLNEQERALYVLLLTTGCRIGEALALRWQDIDEANMVINVTSTLRKDDRGISRPAPGTKTSKKGIILPLAIIAHDALKAHRHHQRRSSTHPLDIRGYVFLSRNGTPLSYESARLHFRKIVAELGLPPTTLHMFRHLVTSKLIEGGVSERVAQDLLGHRTATTTTQVYMHVNATQRRTATTAMDAYVSALETADDTTTPASS